MTALFRRVVNVAVAPTGTGGALGNIPPGMGLDLSNLDCVFRAKKTLKAEPNTCEVKIYNLARSTRAVLETPGKLILRLEAGYPGAVSQIYLGEVRSAHTTREGPDVVTEITTGDSEKDLQSSRLNLSVGPRVPTSVALLAIARSFKNVGLGNVQEIAGRLAASGSAFFGAGSAMSGSSAQMLTDFCRSADLEWSIQDGVMQILQRGGALNDKAVYLSSETGLIGSPSVDHKGVVSATALLQPDLRPGRKVEFNSMSFKGGYRIEKCEYSGDTAGNDWQVKLSCRKY